MASKAIMLASLSISGMFVAAQISIAAGPSSDLMLGGGKENGGTNSFSIGFGLERWENGKKSEFNRLTWWVECASYDVVTRKPGANCSVEQLTFTDLKDEIAGVVITRKGFSSYDGTLQINHGDWERGNLSFTITPNDETKIEVDLKTERTDGFIYLTGFSAIALARSMMSGKAFTYEYRIPKYTLVYEPKIVMRGFFSEDTKARHEFESKLSELDLKIQKDPGCAKKIDESKFFENFYSEHPEFKKISPEELDKSTDLPKGVSDALGASIKKSAGEQLLLCYKGKGMSEAGLESARNFFKLIPN